MVIRGWSILWVVFLQAVGFVAPVLAQTVTTYVDRNPVPIEETVQFVVRFNGSSPGGEPDLSPLEKDFEVLGTAQSTQTSIINGRTSTVTQWVSTLAPKRAGAIVIQPIRVGSEVSAPLTLTVLASGQGGQDRKARDIFIDIQVNPTDPFVQGQVTYTVKLYHAVPIREGRLDEPNSTEVLVEKLGEDRSYETVLDGRRFQVIERQYALYPQRSGDITLPPLGFTGQVPERRRARRSLLDEMMGGSPGILGNDPFDALFQTTRAVRTRSESVTLNVKPMPTSFTGDHWLPAEEVVLQEKWMPEIPDQQAFQVGEPITRTITLLARGSTGAQLPDIPTAEFQGTKVYPDRAVTDTKVEGSSPVGIRQQKLALVPTEPGTIQLPAINIPWWDLNANQTRVASLPSRTIRVVALPGKTKPARPVETKAPSLVDAPSADEDRKGSVSKATPKVTVVAPTQDSGLLWWEMGAGVLAVLWAITGVGWWYERKKRFKELESQPSKSDLIRTGNLKQTKAAFEKACRNYQPKDAKKTLLQWAAIKWPINPPLGLAGLAQRLSHPQAQAAIWEFDRQLYAPEKTENRTEWDGQSFCRIMCLAMEETQCDTRSSQEDPLPPLYLTGT